MKKSNATVLTGTVTLLQKSETIGVCLFQNTLGMKDIALFNCEKNQTTTPAVMALEEIGLRYSPTVRGNEFEINKQQSFFEFRFADIWKVRDELKQLGAIVLMGDYLPGFQGYKWDVAAIRK